MKYFFLLITLLIHTAPLPAQSEPLASIEIIETSSKTAPPVENKKKKKKQLKNKKHKLKHLKKANKNQNGPKDFVKIGILFNLIGTCSLSAIALVLALLSIGSVFLALFLIFALIATFFALIFLMVFFLYIGAKKRKQNKTITLKKTEETLRAEVPYLSPARVDLYLSLNEELTAATIQQNVLINSKEGKSRREWADTKVEIKKLNTKINYFQEQIKRLRTHNKSMKVVSKRG